MKNKLLATIVVLTLLIGIFASAIAFSPTTKAVEEHSLFLFTAPPGIPIVGAGLYTEGSWVNLTATDPYIVGNTKYVFASWDFDGVPAGSANPTWLQMNTHSDRNATAHYNVQYKVALNPNPFTVQGVTDWIWSAPTGWVQTNTMWVDVNTNAEVGVEGLWSSPPGVYATPNAWAYLVNFTGDATGYTDWGWIWTSDPFNVTGPKTASSQWAFMYTLYVNSDPNPPVPNPAGTGWYNAGQIVALNAPDYSLNFAVYRYTLDHWAVDGVTKSGNPINVTMNTNHTAIAYYKRQSFVYLEDNVGNFSGIQDSGKWYDDGKNYTFTAPTPLPIGPGVRYDFRYWDKPGYGWTSTSNPLIIAFDATWDGEHLRGRWQTQYYMLLACKPTGVPGYLYPDSATTGWYDAGSTITIKALPEVDVGLTQRYIFQDWKDHLGGWTALNNYTFAITTPQNLTAEYKLQYLAKWKAMPSSITVPGFPGQTWVDNDTWIAYGAPATDTTTQFVFYYWTINSVTYNQGNTTIPLFVCGPIDGTAYYANATKITMTPDSVYKTSPDNGYCTKFNVTITASNFDANRLLGGQPMDIYGFEFRIQWDTSLLEVTNVYLNLDAFFAPNTYFIAKNEIGAGYYLIAATVKGNYTGFSGTKPVFTLTFHVIRDACYNQVLGNWIYFQTLALSNHLGNGISPELSYNNCWYQVTAPQPTLEIRNAVDHTNVVTVSKNVPTSYFDAEVYLNTGVKVHDFYVVVTYDSTMVMAESVVVGNYLQAPYAIFYWDVSTPGYVYVQVVQDSSVPLQNGSGVLFTIHFKVTATKIWTTASPWPMTSMININYAWLSVMCPTPAYQTTLNGLLGVNANLQYNYNPLPGDLNFDGWVDVLDLQLIADNYHTMAYDIVVNGDTDLYDLVFVALRFGNHV